MLKKIPRQDFFKLFIGLKKHMFEYVLVHIYLWVGCSVVPLNQLLSSLACLKRFFLWVKDISLPSCFALL